MRLLTLAAPIWAAVWPGQKVPVSDVRLVVSVVSGFKLIGMSPMNKAHRPCGQSPPFVHTLLLFAPR